MPDENNSIGVAIAMSGGVDSSVAAYLLKKAGYNTVGITFKFFGENLLSQPGSINDKSLKKFLKAKQRSCCDVAAASLVAKKLNIEHRVVDLTEEFKKYVIEPFVNGYSRGITPNPCIVCNESIKWKNLITIADELRLEKVATGHFAKICDSSICRADDKKKDQAYFLYRIDKPEIERTLFPLGKLTKIQVREIASNAVIPTADRLESHEVCFYSKGSLRKFLEKNGVADKPGFLLDIEGNILGNHSGWMQFTIGQRHGHRVSSNRGRLYVVKTDPQKHEIVLGPREAVMKTKFSVSNAVFHTPWKIGETKETIVQIRHFGDKIIGEVVRTATDSAEVFLTKPVFAPTIGQSAVFFVSDCIVGGGIIYKVLE